MSDPVWLRTAYYVLATDVMVGDVAPWGTVVATIPPRGTFDWTHLIFRAGDGTEDIQLLGRGARIPLVAMNDPIGRGAPPSLCVAA